MGNFSVWRQMHQVTLAPNFLIDPSFNLEELLIFAVTMLFVFMTILYVATSKSGSRKPPVFTSNIPKQKIGVAGGEIRHRACVIVFSPGAFKEEAEVEVKLQIDRTKWPTGYYGITPMLYLEANKPLLIPATVKLYSWFMIRLTDKSKYIEATVFCYLEDQNKFEAISSFPSDESAEFQLKSCKPIFVGVPEQFLYFQVHVVTGYLANTGGNNFKAVFFLQNSNIEDEDYDEEHVRINFNPMILKIGDRMNLRFSCSHPAGFRVEPAEDFRFTIDEDFLKFAKSIHFKMCVTSNQETTSQRIGMRTHIDKNGTTADNERPFEYRWVSNEG